VWFRCISIRFRSWMEVRAFIIKLFSLLQQIPCCSRLERKDSHSHPSPIFAGKAGAYPLIGVLISSRVFPCLLILN
jgi:hypothetical protein